MAVGRLRDIHRGKDSIQGRAGLWRFSLCYKRIKNNNSCIFGRNEERDWKSDVEESLSVSI